MLESCFDVIHDLVCLFDHFCTWDSQFHVLFTKAWPKALRMDGSTKRPTDQPTDTPSYRDARMHLKIYTSISIIFVSAGNLSSATTTFGWYARELFLCHPPIWCHLDHFCTWSSQFWAFFTKSWPKASRTDWRTDRRTHPLIEMRGRI